jgi:glycosyltransferase involved in cell wall biosynthesis
VKIAYIGDFINHGTSLQTIGTSLVIILSKLDNVASIDVYCPQRNQVVEEFQIPDKINIISFYKYNHPFSIAKLLNVSWKSYDLIIFNMLPTGYGKDSLSNATALLIPLILTKLLRIKNIRIIYHNSVFTNNVEMLGYNSVYDRFRAYFLKNIEKTIFKNIQTYVLLNLYKERIDRVIAKNRVQVMNARYLEAVTTVYMNNIMDTELLDNKKSEVPVILLHGFWGPQKNIELALSSLLILKNKGIKFKLVISGGINTHFLDYQAKFKKLLDNYADIVDEYLGYVKEKDIMDIFLKADLLILPYNTPGGHSGVLEQALLFNLNTIAIDFPEYEEQAAGNSFIKLTNSEHLCEVLMLCLNLRDNKRTIEIRNKVIITQNNIKFVIDTSQKS